ncbi:MAG: hypothetical protein MUP61_00855 [Burkholderiales bacterium]|nr:hypothetical protein [Burkholderiales bacterium]
MFSSCALVFSLCVLLATPCIAQDDQFDIVRFQFEGNTLLPDAQVRAVFDIDQQTTQQLPD